MRGQFGLTVLIIFIALIVTAAVAAGVIIYTTQSLQQKALQTGMQSKGRVSTGVEVARVLGYQFDYSTQSLTTDLQRISVISPIVRLMAGSNPINFNDIAIILTTDKQKFYSISLRTETGIPVALHGRLEGGKIIVTGFVQGESVSKQSVTFNSSSNLSYSGTYISVTCTGTGPYTCTATINDSYYNTPISQEDALRMLYEMKNALKIETPSMLVGLAIRGTNIYLEKGEIYEWRMLLPQYLEPEEKYTLQIIPKDGYITQVDGSIPTVLQAVVVDIYTG